MTCQKETTSSGSRTIQLSGDTRVCGLHSRWFVELISRARVANIQNDLQMVLNTYDDSGDFSFSFEQSHSEAPNPVLRISGLPGIIGLPLGPRDAADIKAQATQAHFGIGERTVVDPSVRHTWELDASKVGYRRPRYMLKRRSTYTQVAFGNSWWDTWIESRVKNVCRGLCVNYESSQPRCELYKLLLYETGSQCVQSSDVLRWK